MMKQFSYFMLVLLLALLVLSVFIFSKRQVATVYVSSRSDLSGNDYKQEDILGMSSFKADPAYEIISDGEVSEVYLARYKMKGYLIYCQKTWTAEEVKLIESETKIRPIQYERVNNYQDRHNDKLPILFPCRFD